MQFHGAGDSAIHLTQLSVTASLLRAGVSLVEATSTVLEATRAAVANDPEWDWRREELKILRMGSDFIVKHPELIILLPDKWRQPFEEALTQGRRADIGYNRGGFYVRGWNPKIANDGNNDQSNEQPKVDANQAKNKSSTAAPEKKIRAIPFEMFDEA